MKIASAVPFHFNVEISKLTKLMTIGVVLTIIGFFLPISSKASNNIFYGLVLLPFIISLFTKERYHYSLGDLSPYYFFFVIVMGLFAFPDEPVKAIKYVIYLVCFWVVVTTIVSRQILNEKKFAIWLMAITFVFCFSLLFIHFIINGEPISSRPNFWATWRSGSPINACMLLVFFTAVGIATLPKYLQLPLGVSAILVSLIIQSLFQTRSGIAGLLGAGTFMVLAMMANKKMIGQAFFITISILIVGIVILYHLDFFDILVARGNSYRSELYRVTFSEYLTCNKFTGCGYNYEFQSTLTGGIHIAHPHSIYGSLLLYLGPVSLIALLVLLLKAFLMNLKTTSPWFYGVAASSAFFLVDGKNILDHPNIIWVCLILPLAIIDGQSKLKKLA
ncbi:YfhO family protein [Endozoicomonas acroporae]|uniref:YfhO family protein n=1 Tax=Endozoicomonas acroporae TaxID=1701104 RepID=UPI0013D4AD17|nr:YfhO family protein [Endozoicomonas acroporae]